MSDDIVKKRTDELKKHDPAAHGIMKVIMTQMVHDARYHESTAWSIRNSRQEALDEAHEHLDNQVQHRRTLETEFRSIFGEDIPRKHQERDE